MSQQRCLRYRGTTVIARSTELEQIAPPGHRYAASYMMGVEESSQEQWQQFPDYVFHTSGTALDYAIVMVRHAIDATLAAHGQQAPILRIIRPHEEQGEGDAESAVAHPSSLPQATSRASRS